jgi:hypothetical protein
MVADLQKRHAKQWALYTLCLVGVLALLGQLLGQPYVHQKITALMVFFSLLTLLTGMLSIALLKNDKFNSVSIILGSTVLRLILSLLFVFILLWGGDENILWFVINFFIIYLLYLLFDIYGLITNLRLHLK